MLADQRTDRLASGIDVRAPAIDPAALEAAFDWLRWVDATFSTYHTHLWQIGGVPRRHRTDHLEHRSSNQAP